MQIVKSSAVTWVDLHNPSFQEIHALMRDFRVHPKAANQLKNPTMRPLVEDYQNLVFIALHFPIFNEEERTSKSAEIDFIITPHMLFTNRYQIIEPLELLLKRCSSLPSRQSEQCLARGPFFLFYSIVKELFRFSLREIDHIHEKISSIEAGIFAGHERDMVEEISFVRRDIINFASTLEPQRLVLENLVGRRDLIDEQTKPYLHDLQAEYHKVLHLIKTKKEMIEALHDTNQSLLEAKTNEIMKILTIMAFVTFPLMLLSSVFGMNTATLPLAGTPGDFWIIIGIMLTATVGFFAYFKRKQWF